MGLDFLLNVFRESASSDAIVWKNQTYNYGWLLDQIESANELLERSSVSRTAVVALEADFSPRSVAFLLALIDRGSVVVPRAPSIAIHKPAMHAIAQTEWSVQIDRADLVAVTSIGREAKHEFYRGLREQGESGLVLFTSGSTGAPKAAVHSWSKLLQKYRTRRHNLRSIVFLMFDHIGGIDTLFYCLSNGSCIVTLEDRSPEAVCDAIVRHEVDVLPVTPTFLNFLLLSRIYEKYDISRLKFITYGAEVMPEGTLKRAVALLPNTQFLQKFGATEVGTLRSQSLAKDSLWVRLGGEGYEVRVVDGLLQIKADASMIGYLNAPSPFTPDGWFQTGDAVERDGEYLRILGRQSDVINVGGEKVFPAEVEEVLLGIDNVTDAAVFGEPHQFMGNVVCARVVLDTAEDLQSFLARAKKTCRAKLPAYKIPVKISISSAPQHTDRHKKRRSMIAPGEPSE